MANCTRCGTPNPLGKKFCGKCGKAIPVSQEDPPITPSESQVTSVAWFKSRPKVMIATAAGLAVVIVVAILIGILGSKPSNTAVNDTSATKSNTAVNDTSVIKTYLAACAPSDYISGGYRFNIPTAISETECMHVDGAGAPSTLFVVGSSGIRSTIQILSGPKYGNVCFVVGKDWVAVPSNMTSTSGVVTEAQDATFLKGLLGGKLNGHCEKPVYLTPTTPGGAVSQAIPLYPTFGTASSEMHALVGNDFGAGVTVALDPNNSKWIEFQIGGVESQGGRYGSPLYGFLHLVNGVWTLAVESAMKGGECEIPLSVAKDFGFSGYSVGQQGCQGRTK
jgi:hypothetical protein